MKIKILLSSKISFMSIVLLLTTVHAVALDYSISFSGFGASTNVDSVQVQNLTKGTSVTVPTGSVLNLNDVANAVDKLNADIESVGIYPNPIQTSSTLTFNSIKAGNTQIMAYTLEGKKTLEYSVKLEEGTNSFQLNLPAGIYNIQIIGNGYHYNAKAISQSLICSSPQLSMNGQSSNTRIQKTKNFASTSLLYHTGDQLLYKAYSGKNITVVTDKPLGSKTINFEFVECKDADNNYYGVVRIGDQIWMLENLKTGKYNDGSVIPYVTDSATWANNVKDAYCWYNYDTTKKDVYGALYNWDCVGTSKLAPKDWHVAYDEEWTILENYLTSNGHNFDGTTTGNKMAKSLASTTLWQSDSRTDTIIGSIGNNPSANNSSGFSAVPGGCLYNGFNNQLGITTNWWTATAQDSANAWSRDLFNNSVGYSRYYEYFRPGKSVRCVRYTGDLPHVTTTIPGSIKSNSAVSGGSVVYEGSSAVIARGVCWSTTSGPTIDLATKTNEGTGLGAFVSTITGLTNATTYYVRAYVTNGSSTTYGLEQQFTTSINDYDGVYTMNGTMVDAVNANLVGPYPNEVYLEAVDANSIVMFDPAINTYGHLILNITALSYYGSFAPIFTFDSNNKITAVTNYYGQPAANTRSAELDPSGINTFDPVTHTICVSYWMNQTSVIVGHRTHFVETFTFKRSR